MRLAIIIAAFAASASAQVQIDYNTQVKNKTVTPPGGAAANIAAVLNNCPFDTEYPTLAAAIANIPAYGCLNVYGVGSGPITISASNVTLNCSPGSSIKAVTNASTVTITGNNVTLDGCTIDGNETANPTWVKTGISATGVSNLKLLNVIVTNSQNDTGISIQNAANFEVINPNITAGIAAINISSTPSGTGNTSGTVRGGVLSKIVGAVPVAGQDVLVAFTSGASGLNQTINGLVIDDVTMNNGGSSWCFENNAVTGSGTKIYSENVVLQNSRCYNTYGAAQRGISSFAGSNHARAIDNIYDGGGFAATITMEFASGDDQHAIHNTIRNMGSIPTFSISKDSVGKDFQAVNNNLVGTLALYIDDASVIPGFGNSIVKPIITGNSIDMVSSTGAAITLETNGSSSPANSILGAIISGNQITGNGGSSYPIGLVNFATDGGVVDNTLVAGNHSVNFPYGFGSGSNQTNTILSANRWEGATNECTNAGCDGVISATDIGFPWVISNSISAPSFITPGLAAPTCVTGTGLDGTGGVNCNSLVSGNPYAGEVLAATTGTPASSSVVVTLTVPSGTFSSRPFCVIGAAYTFDATNVPGSIAQSRASTATSIIFIAVGALTTGQNYWFNYQCKR